MNSEYLDFERPIAEFEGKIRELTQVSQGHPQEIDLKDEIDKLRQKSDKLTQSIFASLTAKQIVQLARHPERPYTLDYIEHIFTDFDELKGDRRFSAAPAIVGGLANLADQPVMVIGHQKGRTTKQKVARNFGMASPEGFRRALRLMQMAERFNVPVITFIDTPGAYPGIGAEERNQSEAIARNLLVMSELKVPIICVIIGEGCSGGALAIGVGDRVMMLQYSYYSVISPEGCASILWKSAERAGEAAAALNLTADRLLELGLIDQVINEPLGGAHRDHVLMAKLLQQHLLEQLAALKQLSLADLLEQRYQRLLKVGQ